MSSNIRVARICQHCGGEFIAKTTVTKYCSDPCAKRAYKVRKRNEKVQASNKKVRQTIEKPIIELQSKEFLSVADTCKLLDVSRATIWRLAKSGQLKTANMGSRVIIRKSDLNTLFT